MKKYRVTAIYTWGEFIIGELLSIKEAGKEIEKIKNNEELVRIEITENFWAVK